MQTRISYPGSAYPAGRPPFFAMHYIARIFREGAIAQFRLKPIAVVMLVKIVTDEDRNWYQRPASLFNMDLARDLDCSEDTVQRTRDELIKAGLLHYERHGDRRSGTYWVEVPPHWEDSPGPQRRPEHPTGRVAAEAIAVGTAGGSAEATADQSFPKKNLFRPPPVPVPWVVVERLRMAGVELATEAAKDARRNVFTPELALACVDWFLQPENRAAYGTGVLLHRFRRADASRLPADHGWPPPNPQAALRQSRKQEAERAAEARREADTRAAEKAARTKELTQKLLQWGDSIDRLTQEERVALVADKGPAFVREVRRAVCWRDHALIRGVLLDAFAAQYPRQFQTDVRTSAPDLWLHNPHLTPLSDTDPSVETMEMHYPLVHQSNQRPYHFLHGYVQHLEERLKLKIPLTAFQGDLHLSDKERASRPEHLGPLPERFWIVMAGGKYDFTAKRWNPDSYQQVVDHFRGRIEFLQCGEGNHWHPPLRGVTSLIGRTSIRDFLHLMYFAEGVVCPVTFAMHLAAAVPVRPDGPPNRACVVISGGREPPHWEAYPQHQFLHTIGQLDCCATGGCWKSRCQPVGDGDDKDRRNRCERPVAVSDGLVIPQCLELIRPAEVIAAIERTLEGWNMPRAASPPLSESRSPQVAVRQNGKAAATLSGRRRVLIEFRHGLGDAAQFTAVLRHLRHYHSDWDIDVASLRGKHSAFHGLCRQSLILDELRREHGDYAETFRLDWDECRSADPR